MFFRKSLDVLIDLTEEPEEKNIRQKKLKFFKGKSKAKKLAFEYYLPLVMERLVMTVEAGLDVVAGIKVLTEQNSQDPVTESLHQVLKNTEAGLNFSESLREVAVQCPSASVKHAFIHLALAYEQGGELVMPLRELSNATQLQYQENIEEQIAKLPVKATMPLVVIFAGLILFFVTAPVIQVISITSKGALQ